VRHDEIVESLGSIGDDALEYAELCSGLETLARYSCGKPSETGRTTVRTRAQAPKVRLIPVFAALSVIIALPAGCGDSAGVQALPEASAKALIRRKVDAVERRPGTQGTTKSPGRHGSASHNP
jgi:hypothetical protein